jgi:hypothetical protein
MSNSILSRPCTYAVRAMAHVAEHPSGRLSSSRENCDQENIPPSFLGKVFLPVSRYRMVRFFRGTIGGVGGHWGLFDDDAAEGGTVRAADRARS